MHAPRAAWTGQDLSGHVNQKTAAHSSDWNGRFGRLARRDIWLEREVIWHVKARNGDGDSPVKAWAYTSEDDAVGMVERLLNTGGDGWKKITNAPETPPPPPMSRSRTRT